MSVYGTGYFVHHLWQYQNGVSGVSSFCMPFYGQTSTLSFSFQLTLIVFVYKLLQL